MLSISLQEVEELIGLAPEKVLLKWMNFHLKKAGYEKQVTNFSSDVKVRRLHRTLIDSCFSNSQGELIIEYESYVPFNSSTFHF